MSDFRSDPMPSAEGRGRARAAWDAYSRASNRMFRPAIDTVLGPSIRSYSVNHIADLLGFWMLWQLNGGYQGFRDLGMSRSAIYRKTAAFRKTFKVHPDEFELPGVQLVLTDYLAAEEAEGDTPN